MDQPFNHQSKLRIDDAMHIGAHQQTGTQSLHKIFARGEEKAQFWADVLASMAGKLMNITAEVSPDMGPLEITAALQEEYRFKPLIGLSSALDRPHMVPFIEDTVNLNGEEVPGISQVVAAFDKILHKERLLEPVPYTRIAGNLSLENMQYDYDEHELVLMGSKRRQPFGDLRHDLARFAFSLQGGQKNLKLRTNGILGIKLEWMSGYPFDDIQNMFTNWLEVLNPALVRQIPLIIALDCFASLKNTDLSPLDQQALLVRGLIGMKPFVTGEDLVRIRHVA